MDDLLPRLQRSFDATHSIERELGGGGMSRTYLATERALNRRVVIKVLAPELLAGVSVERFKREVLLAAQLQHPHVVPVIASGDAEGLPWFTMPFVDGPSLRQRLTAGAMPIGEVIAVLRDVARALAFAHGRGVVHRDIKPDNVLLSEGSATVTDFGIAKAISASQKAAPVGATLTKAGMSVGTPAYMSPEQAAGDASTDHRADLYAFGAMAYEMLAGRPPFVSESPTRLLAMQMTEPPRPVTQLRPDTPPALADLVMTCLAKEPDARPKAAADLSRVLDAVVTTGSGAAAPVVLRGGAVPFAHMLAMWGAATTVVLAVTWAATVTVGLPTWAMTGASLLMGIGLVALLFTGWVQRASYRQLTTTPTLTPGGGAMPMGTMATLAIKASPHVSWQRTWKGGVVAVTSFVLLLGGFMTARAYGIGPVGSLIAKGALAANEKLILTDFKSPASDTSLGVTITEALRADLAQSRSIRVLSRANVRDVLRLMRRSNDAGVDLSLAREVATREGIKAIVDGEIVQLGNGYVVAARLLTTQTGDELGAFRETASNLDELLPAVERMSRALRERIGESFKDIRAAAPLERVTTSSVEALKLYVRGMRAIEEQDDIGTGGPLLEEAIRLDPGFAMAYRKYAVSLGNRRTADRSKIVQMLVKAYELRDRLSESERLLTTASYWSTGPREDIRQAVAALEALRQRDSTYFPAINNLGVLKTGIGDFRGAADDFRAAARLEPGIVTGWTNLAGQLVELGEFTQLLAAADSAEKALGENSDAPWRMRAWTLGRPEQAAEAEAFFTKALGRFADRMTLRIDFSRGLSSALRRQGRVREAQRLQALADSGVASQGQTPDGLQTTLERAQDAAVLGNDTASARRLAQEAIKRYDWRAANDADRQYGRWGVSLLRAGLPDLARQMADSLGKRFATSNVRDDGRMLALLRGELAMHEKQFDTAINTLQAAITNYPENGVGQFGPSLALAYIRAERPDSAIAVFERYLASNSRSRINGTGPRFEAVAFERLGSLYEDKGNKAKALQHYEMLLGLWKNADPELQPLVRDVRARVERLRRGTG
ncbi:serine/threonine protein kinase [Gemmatimonas phototrophica]|uniref:serine/threonine protein kinase n=1 Tax=Gemmatimonas phototrophica TaxID=1379270 RepID=UPI0006A717E4|nr:serine/threonine protein kinase [Gemmatimonas phototrophica]